MRALDALQPEPSVKWDLRMLRLAREVSTWSKDPSTKVGAVITDAGHRVLSVGFNGFPKGVEDKEEWLNDRSKKYPLTIHAEKNAIAFANSADLVDATIYTYPMPPCVPCTSYLLQNGISRVVSLMLEDEGHVERWGKDVELSRDLLLGANKLYQVYRSVALEKANG